MMTACTAHIDERTISQCSILTCDRTQGQTIVALQLTVSIRTTLTIRIEVVCLNIAIIAYRRCPIVSVTCI